MRPAIASSRRLQVLPNLQNPPHCSPNGNFEEVARTILHPMNSFFYLSQSVLYSQCGDDANDKESLTTGRVRRKKNISKCNNIGSFLRAVCTAVVHYENCFAAGCLFRLRLKWGIYLLRNEAVIHAFLVCL